MSGATGLRIGIDLFSLVPGAGRGAGFHRYTSGLLSGLAELEDHHHYVLFVNRQNASMFPSGGRFTQVTVPFPPQRVAWPFRLLWQHGLLPLLARRQHLDLVHFPMDTASLVLGIPFVVTIHDLIADVYYPAHFPGSINPLKSRYLFLAKRRSSRSARTVVCVSHATGDLVHQHYGVPVERIAVIPHGLDAFRGENGSAPANAAPPYVLVVSSLSPHKNLVTTVRAFLSARRAHQLTHELRIVGMRGTDAGPIERFLDSEEVRAVPVRYLGFVDDAALATAYGSASLLLSVSHVEGFGLTPLEAMAAGVPVIASNVSSLPEVCGDAALLVSPGDEEGIARAIGSVLTDSDLATRLAAAGRARASTFSWVTTARRTRAVYEAAASP